MWPYTEITHFNVFLLDGPEELPTQIYQFYYKHVSTIK